MTMFRKFANDYTSLPNLPGGGDSTKNTWLTICTRFVHAALPNSEITGTGLTKHHERGDMTQQKMLNPGEAVLTYLDGKVTLVACDVGHNLPAGTAAYSIRGGVHQIKIATVLVPAVSVVLRITAAGKPSRYYWAWVNELEESVIATLANQSELPIRLTDPEGASFGRSLIPNEVRDVAQKYLGIISRLAANSPWSREHFAAAVRGFVEQHNSTAEAEWLALDKARNA